MHPAVATSIFFAIQMPMPTLLVVATAYAFVPKMQTQLKLRELEHRSKLPPAKTGIKVEDLSKINIPK